MISYKKLTTALATALIAPLMLLGTSSADSTSTLAAAKVAYNVRQLAIVSNIEQVAMTLKAETLPLSDSSKQAALSTLNTLRDTTVNAEYANRNTLIDAYNQSGNTAERDQYLTAFEADLTAFSAIINAEIQYVQMQGTTTTPATPTAPAAPATPALAKAEQLYQSQSVTIAETIKALGNGGTAAYRHDISTNTFTAARKQQVLNLLTSERNDIQSTSYSNRNTLIDAYNQAGDTVGRDAFMQQFDQSLALNLANIDDLSTYFQQAPTN